MHFIQLSLSPSISDVSGNKIEKDAARFLGIETGEVKSSTVYAIAYDQAESKINAFGEHCLKDEIVNELNFNSLLSPGGYQSFIAIAKLPGVTDDEGISAQKAFLDYLNLNIETNTQQIFTQQIFYLKKALTKPTLKRLAEELLGNPLIHHFHYDSLSSLQSLNPKDLYVPKVRMSTDISVGTIDLDLKDAELIALSKKMVLALNLEEMKAIQAHYKKRQTKHIRNSIGLPSLPTDCELEILAQTWSEHCKHKEFNATIKYENKETGESKEIVSLFKTFIKGATDNVAEQLKENGNDWLIKVFTDNAGVVKINNKSMFVWKVETHNSPSALDPYGGAITGILGNNRDPLGTGVGGARLLFNTNVLCFGSPYFDGDLLTGQLHPSRIFSGVRHGIEDGGNKSGVPTVNGSIVFDDRFRGKPLVYCGTGGILPHHYLGKNSWEKPIDPEDRIFVCGGRVGKDGIHGATFSSVEIDEHSPMSAVQIGSPITQKLLSDFLIRACNLGLVKCCTDNGAGGLSSSIGELATISNGAEVALEKVPLKYSGLKPWEIFVSESQERMTLVIEPEKAEKLQQLAIEMEVELTEIGRFTDSGYLQVNYEEQIVAHLEMEFLHEGDPIKVMEAVWEKPELVEPILEEELDFNDILLKLMGSLNICSRESVIRQYDHEVKGKTTIKPLMGPEGKAPQDAAVVRVDFDSYEGIAISNGILPRYGDIDAYEMSAGAFDEAVRQIIAVGGKLPNLSPSDDIFWSINDNFCVPDSAYHPENNPDGKLKLAKLVQMCEALYDMATCFAIPLTSGKDSMKNDYKGDGVKISIPPTILYSMAAKIPDIRRTVTSDFKAEGDLIYQVGLTYDELGASEFHQLWDAIGVNVPKVRPEQAKSLYIKMMEANDLGLIESAHDLSDGGLAVALTESAFGGKFGASISLDRLSDLKTEALLFSESHSRFVVSIDPKNKTKFESILGDKAFFLGTVTKEYSLKINRAKRNLISMSLVDLQEAWDNGLHLQNERSSAS